MNQYESYKESGIDWLGEIPSCWDVSRCKAKFVIKKRIVGYDGPPVLSITQKGIVEKDTESGDGQLASSYANYQWVYPGDFAMNHMDLLTGWVDCSKLEGVTSPDYRVFAPISDDVDRSYFTYLFQHCYSGKVFYGYGQGVSNYGRWRLPADEFKNFYLPCPSLDEQKAIASYLDEKTGEIDSLIVDAEKSIELLEEYRKSVISEAVTKGLDPDAQMKDSGIDWIGEIPEHWEAAPLKRYLKCAITDGPHETPEFYEEGVPFISAEAVSAGRGRIDFSHMRGFISEEYYEECCKKYIPQNGDIYMIKSGATTGRVALVDTNQKFTIWSPLAAIRCNENLLLPVFAFFAFQSNGFQKQVEDGWTYGTQQNIGMRTIERLIIAVPPLDEHRKVAQSLASQVEWIDAQIIDREQLVVLLGEYRRSLISEAVTGKFKVPGVE